MIHVIWKYVFLLFFIFLLNSGNYIFSQSKGETSNKHFGSLSKGILLVRLDNREKEIQLLKKSDDFEQIKKIKERVTVQNEKIVAAFKNYYTFSKVCFYYLGGGKAIVKEDNFNEVYSDLDSVLCDIDKSLPIYLLFFERKHWHPDPFGHYSFVMYSLKGNVIKRLEKPFPYNFETLERGGLFSLFRTKYDFNKGVKRMNLTLEKYHSIGTKNRF